MKLFYRDDGVEMISKDGVMVNDFFQKNPQYDFLRIYHLEEKITLEEDKIFIGNEVISDFSPKQLEMLKLPPRYPHLFKCQASGAILQDDYKITPIFETTPGKPMDNYKQLKGTFISFHDKQKYTLPHEIYAALQLIEKINNTKDYGRKLTLVQQLKILEIKLNNNSSLEDISVSTASHFSLRITDKDNFTVLPVFLKEVNNGETNDADTEEVGELNGERESTVEDLLPQQHIEKYHEYFQNHAQVALHTQVADNKFLVLDDKLKKIIQVIKDAHVTKTVAARRALYACPNTYLRKEMGEEFSDDLVDTFIPDARYISQRIDHIGEWQPKAQSFLPSSHNEWVPKDVVGIRLDNELVLLKPEKIPAAIEKMQQALQDRQKTVAIDNQEMQATQENIDLLAKANINYKENVSSATQKKSEQHEAVSNTKVAAIIKDNIEGDNFLEDVVSRKRCKKYIPKLLKTRGLHKHQRRGVNWLQESWNSGRRGVLLADDMGLGKTLQVLVFLAWLREIEDGKKPFLIVGPTGLLKNWQDEHNTHLHAPGLGNRVIGHGKDLARIKQNRTSQEAVGYFASADFVLTTYDSLARNEDIFRCVAWQTIVFDECQYIKNPATYRCDMAKAMAAEFSIGMTGTPVENGLSDLWCIVDAVHPGVLSTYKDFKLRYEKSKNGHKNLTRKLTKEMLPPFLLRRMKDKHLDGLPQKREYVRDANMTKTQADAYFRIIEDIRNRSLKHIVAIQKLRSVSLAPFVDSKDLNDDDFIASSARLYVLFEVLDEIKNREEKAIIFLENRQMQGKLIAVIQRHYELAEPPQLINGTMNGHTRKKKVDDFQKLPHGFALMVISPKAGGVGLTITNANNVIHLERWWNPAVEDQCSDRVYRIGQEKDVNVYVIRALLPHANIKSYDEVLHGLLSRKRELSRKVIVPTTFEYEDRKFLFEETTGCTYDNSKDFYSSNAWVKLREETLAKYGRKCQKCGATPPIPIEVDHIKPRVHRHDLELDPNNLQVLCKPCNREKGDRHETDYR